jgi:hypothetical protein
VGNFVNLQMSGGKLGGVIGLPTQPGGKFWQSEDVSWEIGIGNLIAHSTGLVILSI